MLRGLTQMIDRVGHSPKLSWNSVTEKLLVTSADPCNYQGPFLRSGVINHGWRVRSQLRDENIGTRYICYYSALVGWRLETRKHQSRWVEQNKNSSPGQPYSEPARTRIQDGFRMDTGRMQDEGVSLEVFTLQDDR